MDAVCLLMDEMEQQGQGAQPGPQRSGWRQRQPEDFPIGEPGVRHRLEKLMHLPDPIFFFF